jgi:1,4-alpha-glucan branching enzyme
MHDPSNPQTVKNQYATLNSVYEIKRETQFRLAGFEDAEEVRLTGSFTDWEDRALRMHREGKAWVVSLPLTGGKHLYKFIVDGNWITDPANPIKEYDWKGNLNSVKMVE